MGSSPIEEVEPVEQVKCQAPWMVAAAGSFEVFTVNPSCFHRLADGCRRRERLLQYPEALVPL
jgi:hypothetical protein